MVGKTCNRQRKGSCRGYIKIKVDVRRKKMTINKEEHYIMIKGLIYQEFITVLNVWVPNNRI